MVLDDGTHMDVDGFFVASAFTQTAPFADDLGLTMLPSGCIEVDELGHTSPRRCTPLATSRTWPPCRCRLPPCSAPQPPAWSLPRRASMIRCLPSSAPS